MQKAKLYMYVAFSVMAFFALWYSYGILAAWVFGAFACGAPAFVLKDVKRVEEEGDK